MDKDFNLICKSDLILDEDGDQIITGYEFWYQYRFDVVRYEDIIRMADEYLGDYEPSNDTKEKYSIR